MFFSIISIVIYFAVLCFGITEENTKGKVIAAGTVILSLFNFYIVCSSGISDSLLLNIIFGALHLLAFLFALIMLIPSKSKSQRGSSHFNVTIEDNGKTQYVDPSETEKIKKSDETNGSDREMVHFRNVHLSEGMICDVHGEKMNFKITMRSGGKLYDFYVKDGQTVAYRTEEMSQPKSY